MDRPGPHGGRPVVSQVSPDPQPQVQPVAPLSLDYATPPPPPVDLRTLAVRQRAAIFCLLAQVVLIAGQFALDYEPDALRTFHTWSWLAITLVADAFTFMLALSVYRTPAGVVGGILTLVPCLGLFILPVIIVDAARILRQHGIRVGLTGASLRDIPRSAREPVE